MKKLEFDNQEDSSACSASDDFNETDLDEVDATETESIDDGFSFC